MKYRLAIFDLDGTLLNTLTDLAGSVNHALEKNGLPLRSIDEVRNFVGNGIRKLIDRAVPENTAVETADKVFSDFKEHYTIHSADSTAPYEGITELLRVLRKDGCLTAVVSNKADFAVKELCKQYFIGLIDVAIGERSGVPRKPSPESVYEVLEALGVSQREAVYIGDSDVDVMTAKNAGLDLIAVDWGFRERELLQKSGAETIVSLPSEIADIIL